MACLSVCVHYAPKIKMTKLIGPNFFENATILTESYAKLFCFFSLQSTMKNGHWKSNSLKAKIVSKKRTQRVFTALYFNIPYSSYVY